MNNNKQLLNRFYVLENFSSLASDNLLLGFGYEVQYRPKTGGEWKTVDVSDPFSDKVTIEFSEPQPFKPYEVRVRSKNNIGPSLVEPETISGYTGEVKNYKNTLILH